MSSTSNKNRNTISLYLPKVCSISTEKMISRSFSDKSIKNKRQHSLSSISKKTEKTKIIWTEGGKEVYLTGTFCNWNKFYLMKKDNKDENFYYLLDLPKGFHQFKFKVDGLWKNSSYYPKINNQGNINNYYDNTSSSNENATISTIDSTVVSASFSNNKNNNITNIITNKNNNINFSFSKKYYCNHYPTKNELRDKTDKKPINFPTECYQEINQKQNEIGNNNFLLLKENDILSGNYSYKDIERKEHILINHLCRKPKNKNVIINSVCIRFRHKNSTFVYYK